MIDLYAGKMASIAQRIDISKNFKAIRIALLVP